MKTLLLVDLNNLVYRFPFVMSNLYFNGVYTGGLYGFVKSLCACINDVRPDEIIVADDYPPYKRNLLGYKSERKKYPEIYNKIIVSRELCGKFLYHSGIHIAKNKGYEADDVIAEVISRKRGIFRKIVIFSNDSDLYQFFHLPEVSFWKGRDVYYQSDFLKDYPQAKLDSFPEEWIFFLALTGGHNNLPKPKGIGPVKAWKIIKDGMIEDYFEKTQLQIVLKYIRLPYDNKMSLSWERESKTFSYSRVSDLLSQHGIRIDRNMEFAFQFLLLGKRKVKV